ncbi:MAG: 16S rRNA (guanine(966)-N(2))-methyltransferase RsmD [Bdellovibrionales bacterium GWB1_55_8]|nr:MAG: 16S rRNA (guanine(966)-N(2))-methyltransferase RsmD [Bdellovibrionales bacterium GWB1_55_8]
MLRLTGGEFRGRMIHSPAGLHTRPTQARLRQALFNSIQLLIPDSNVLDLFAGAGTLGFEAISRGARKVTFVEHDRSSFRLLEKNVEELGIHDRVELVGESVERAVPRLLRGAPFDIVIADPPYAEGWEKRILSGFEGKISWQEVLAPGGNLLIEWGRLKSRDFKMEELPESAPFLAKVREKIYGESVLTTYERAEA